MNLLTKTRSGPSHKSILGKLGLVSTRFNLKGGVDQRFDQSSDELIIKRKEADIDL